MIDRPAGTFDLDMPERPAVAGRSALHRRADLVDRAAMLAQRIGRAERAVGTDPRQKPAAGIAEQRAGLQQAATRSARRTECAARRAWPAWASRPRRQAARSRRYACGRARRSSGRVRGRHSDGRAGGPPRRWCRCRRTDRGWCRRDWTPPSGSGTAATRASGSDGPSCRHRPSGARRRCTAGSASPSASADPRSAPSANRS